MSTASIQQIVRALMQRGTGFDYNSQSWREKRRKRCRAYLTTVRKKFGFDVFPDSRRHSHEYMVDLCWVSLGNKRWCIELALEMEWDAHSHEVQYDFTKLVNVKAPRKIMLCAPWPTHRSETLSEVIRMIRQAKYRTNREQYAIVFFVFTKSDSELVREGIEARAFFINYKGRVTSELIAENGAIHTTRNEPIWSKVSR
jgi:hypothetical protein